MILHCMKKSTWEERKNKEYWGQRDIDAEGFLHCSTIEFFWRIVWLFVDTKEDYVIICINEDKLEAEVRFEDGDNCSRAYPHIYGLVNNSAVVDELPFLRDESGKYMKNPEFMEVEDK